MSGHEQHGILNQAARLASVVGLAAASLAVAETSFVPEVQAKSANTNVCEGGTIYSEHDDNRNGVLEPELGEVVCIYLWNGTYVFSLPSDPAAPPQGPMLAPERAECADVSFAQPGEWLLTNVAATQPVGPGYITQHTRGARWNQFVSVNYRTGQTTSNADLMMVGATQELCITPYSPVHGVVDLSAVLAADAMVPIQPNGDPLRVIDTTNPNGPTAGKPLGAGQSVCANVGHPEQKIFATVASDASKADGFITVYPSNQQNPGTTASLTFMKGKTRSNATISRVGPDGRVCVFANQETHAFLDVKGVFARGQAEVEEVDERPVRLLDTRERGYPAGKGETFCVEAGKPDDYVALVMSATNTRVDGYVSMVSQPGDPYWDHANGNTEAGVTSSSLGIHKIGPDGKACVVYEGAGDLVIDRVGSFDKDNFLDEVKPADPRLMDSREP